MRVRYFAGARAAAGTAEETVAVAAGATVADVVAEIAGRHGAALTRALEAASFLVDGVAVRDRARPVADGVSVDVLPPFAGG